MLHRAVDHAAGGYHGVAHAGGVGNPRRGPIVGYTFVGNVRHDARGSGREARIGSRRSMFASQYAWMVPTSLQYPSKG